MKKIFYVVCFSFVLLSFPSVLCAQDKLSDTNGVYLGLIGGYVIANDMDARFSNSLSSGYFGIEPRNGYLYGAKAGWLTPFTNRILAVEFEYNHLENKFSNFDNLGQYGGGDLSGKISLNLLMVNLLARKPTGRFHPYVGVGFGYADVKVDDMELSNSVLTNAVGNYIFKTGSKGVFAYQALAGLDIDITNNIFVGVGYKYIAPQKISYDCDLTVVNVAMTKVNMEMDYSSHNITLSVAYMF